MLCDERGVKNPRKNSTRASYHYLDMVGVRGGTRICSPLRQLIAPPPVCELIRLSVLLLSVEAPILVDGRLPFCKVLLGEEVQVVLERK